MAHRKVNLTKRIKTPDGLRYCPIVESGNGRGKPDYVVVDGKQERHVEGAHYLEWRENGRRHRLSVSKTAGEAMAQRVRKEAELNARNHGVSIAPTSTKGKRSLPEAVAECREEIKLSKKPKTYAAWTIFRNRAPR